MVANQSSGEDSNFRVHSVGGQGQSREMQSRELSEGEGHVLSTFERVFRLLCAYLGIFVRPHNYT